MAYNNFQNPYMQAMNPVYANQQQRLAQMEQMYPQFAQTQFQQQGVWRG